MAQMLVACGEREANLGRAVRMIEHAAGQGAGIVVLPECLDLGWTWPGVRADALQIPGPASDCLAAEARRTGIHVVAGLTERAGERIYNAAVLISPTGEILLRHRKINELDIARNLYATGDSLAVARTEFGVMGLAICADNFPESLCLGRSLGRMGAQLLLSPCAWAVDADHDNAATPYGELWLGAYRTLTQEYPMTVVGVSNVGWLAGGPWQGRKCIGCSIAMGPGGKLLAMGPYGEDAEALILVEVPAT
ncbi:MAG: carbon-nitrogen hydrolase family protein [Bryobacteraceae bacterium]